MKLNNLFLQDLKTQEILRQINEHKNVVINGLDSSRFTLFVGNVFHKLNKTILLITDDNVHINQYYEDLIRLLPEDKILVYPEIEVLPHEQIITDFVETKQRVRVMQDLTFAQECPRIILTTGTALLRRLIPVSVFRKFSLLLSQGEEIVLKDLARNLTLLGYQRVAMVEEPAQYSIRGGIFDIYPITNDSPYRLEFFGDEIDSIREFNLTTQRSDHNLQRVIISPAREVILPSRRLKLILPEIKNDFDQIIEKLRHHNYNEEANYLTQKRDESQEKLKELNNFPGYEQFLPYFYQKLDSLFDYLNRDALIFSDQIEKVWRRVKKISRDLGETQTTLLEQGSIIPSYAKNFLYPDDFIEDMKKFNGLYFTSQLTKISFLNNYQEINFKTRGVEPYHGQFELLVKRLKGFINKGYRVIITLNSTSKAKRIAKFLQERDLPAIYTQEEFTLEKIVVTAGSLAEGFILDDLKLAIYTEKEVIGKPQRKKRQLRNTEEGVKISSLNELSSGDYVVHENHGIGKYIGVKTLEIQNQHHDYLVIKYAGEDKLYVPIEQVNLVQKYIGADHNSPKLYRLGGNDWKKTKQKVKNSVKKMAIGLLELYADRETIEGYAFSRDMVWQKEFEESFPYEETPDQLKAIEDVKKDMEAKTPMDRLLCGDVGYGKTEVAIRAAFKAVMDGKQIAVLVPTTILAQQHYNTFKERMENYPINIEMVSRFKTPKEQREILKKLSLGKVDIIIGTHRLLSKDIVFNDLGLLIIDEEQRFGVTHKERLKDFKRNVDVLTLSATPIPRTLHMALVGVRNMSVIETPPENRYPIRTYIREFNQELIRDAIRKEIGRKGQIYFVHNRVEDIEDKADMIRKLIPECKVVVAHGQMNEHRLEKLMLDFYNQKYDVLVCTTIIETGLDLPNVNTIMINRAEQMGLAQLYQLRGRVGRSNRIAYAYLLYEKERILSEIAEKRLRAIKEFTNLGSGFKIAMRDLEIRGAGNLLGSEQHGHIAAIGFSLYCKLLEEEIKELKEKGKRKLNEVEINLHLDAYLSDSYILDSKQKVEIYKKIIGLKKEDDISDIIDELIDRFGNPPESVMNLIKIKRIKIKASQIGLEKISQNKKTINCSFKDLKCFDGEIIFKLIDKYPRRIKIRSGQKPVLGIKLYSDENPLNFLEEVIDQFRQMIVMK